MRRNRYSRRRRGNWKCRKIAYPDEPTALEYADGLRAAGVEVGRRAERLRVYQCPRCAKWHLGHAPG